jgi:hypothetical protein
MFIPLTTFEHICGKTMKAKLMPLRTDFKLLVSEIASQIQLIF